MKRTDESDDDLAVEALTLVGREWLRNIDYGVAAMLDIYGPDQFTVLAQPEFESCGSERLWGYRCPFDEIRLHADHLFPSSLGGPTDARNRLTLCWWHNTAKGMDVHDFPWEEGIPDWLWDVVAKMTPWIKLAAAK